MKYEQLNNLHGNALVILRDVFDEETRLAFAAMIATLELDQPKLHAENATMLRSVVIENILETLGVDGPLIERMRMQIANTRADMAPTSLRRQ